MNHVAGSASLSRRSPWCLRLSVALTALVSLYCGDNHQASKVSATRVARTVDLPGCAWASPVRVGGNVNPGVIVATTQGYLARYDVNGVVQWQTQLPRNNANAVSWIAATPVVIDDLLVMVWQQTDGSLNTRDGHFVGVFDVNTGAERSEFPRVRLRAQQPATDGGVVEFLDAHNFSRATLVSYRANPMQLGHVYVGFGNIRDIQPWHGWLFDIDVDAWRRDGGGAAIARTFLTTPQRDCGPVGDSGSDEMICGGGIWAPSGMYVRQSDVAAELWVPTGNGRLNPNTQSYANSVMRVPLDFGFADGCDASCSNFSETAPSPACMQSCRNVFMPRLAPGQEPLAPDNGLCAGMTFMECYARLDLDLGANSPIAVTQVIDGVKREFAVVPAKDGAVYLFDANHFGTMYDRLVIRDFCGDNGGTCTANWAGTMVTQPTLLGFETPLIVVPTFVFDATNTAGVVALAIENTSNGPRLVEKWHAPARGSQESVARFREHTGRAAAIALAAQPYVVIADPGAERSNDGLLYVIDGATGEIAARAGLDGPGHKYILPAVIGQRAIVSSCDTIMQGPTHLEYWDLSVAP